MRVLQHPSRGRRKKTARTLMRGGRLARLGMLASAPARIAVKLQLVAQPLGQKPVLARRNTKCRL
jgi:hypothetical protein